MTRRAIDPLALGRSIAQRVKVFRLKRNLSQREFGSVLGMTRAGVTNIEAGKQRVLIEHLYQLAEQFHVPVQTFLPAL